MRGGNKVLKRDFYQSAFASLRNLRCPEPSTIARGPKARGTPRHWLRWPEGGSTFCGQCCVTAPRLRPALQLDIFIEILLGNSVSKPALGRSWRLSARARDRDHSNPGSPWATLSSWNPGTRSEASEPVGAQR